VYLVGVTVVEHLDIGRSLKRGSASPEAIRQWIGKHEINHNDRMRLLRPMMVALFFMDLDAEAMVLMRSSKKELFFEAPGSLSTSMVDLES